MTPHALPASPYPCVEPTSGERAALAEWIERAAMLDVFGAAPPELRARLGLFVERMPELHVFGATGTASLFVNRVFIDATARAATYTALPETLARLRARGMSSVLVHAHVPTEGDARAEALQRAGLLPYRRGWLKLALEPRLGPASAPEPDPQLELGLCHTDEADAFADLVATGLGLVPETAALIATIVQRPRWHVYVARDRGVPVAAGALFVQGEVGQLGFAATLPAYRGLGLQRALIARRLRVAHALGCSLVASETGEALPGERNPSEHNLRALGLDVLGVRGNWTWPGAPWG